MKQELLQLKFEELLDRLDKNTKHDEFWNVFDLQSAALESLNTTREETAPCSTQPVMK